MNESQEHKTQSYLQDVFRQINEMASVSAESSGLLRHNLEKGLNNETILLELLRKILPVKYGVGRGKIVSPKGLMSRQCDIIIYDALNCPCLFVDENQNQVLPAEGVYCIIEVKTKLNKKELEKAFAVIASVKGLLGQPDVSTNDLITIIPPLGYVIAYDDERSLETIYDSYVSINRHYHPQFSSLSFSKKSPGYRESDEHFLIENVLIINKGEIHHTYYEILAINSSGIDALGLFVTSLLRELDQMALNVPNLPDYYGDVLFENKIQQLTKINGKFVKIFKDQ